MRGSTLLKNSAGLLAIIFLLLSCSETSPELKTNVIVAEEVKAKKNLPACCAKKPSRFVLKKVPK